MTIYTATGRMQKIDLGDEIRVRRDGRIGRTVQVTRDEVWVRFPGETRHANFSRVAVDSVRFLQAQAEVNEDEENADRYEEWCAGEYEKSQAKCASCAYIGHDEMRADRKIAGRWYCFVHAMDIYCD